jgi:hypothetical protein
LLDWRDRHGTMSLQQAPPSHASDQRFATIEARMPTGSHDHLQQLYEREKLLNEEVGRLEAERETLDTNSDRTYILDIEIVALREEWTRINARIAEVLERDLQR